MSTAADNRFYREPGPSVWNEAIEAAAKVIRSQLAEYDHGNNQEHAFAGEVASLLKAVEALKQLERLSDAGPLEGQGRQAAG